MKRILAPIAAALLTASLFTSPSLAHEAHQKNMSDAEMAQMEAQMAPGMHDDMHDMMPDEAESVTVVSVQIAAPASAEAVLTAKVAENRLTSAGDLLGRLHPAATHFPIALLLVAALAELALMVRPTLGLQPTIRFLVAGGAIGAVAAAVLGWFAGGWRFTDRSEVLGLHRWNGTAIALVSLLAWWFAARGSSRAALRVTLAIVAAALILQGYYGGEMVFGPNHMGIS
jgi:uncharacterized membrane protein